MKNINRQKRNYNQILEGADIGDTIKNIYSTMVGSEKAVLFCARFKQILKGGCAKVQEFTVKRELVKVNK